MANVKATIGADYAYIDGDSHTRYDLINLSKGKHKGQYAMDYPVEVFLVLDMEPEIDSATMVKLHKDKDLIRALRRKYRKT